MSCLDKRTWSLSPTGRDRQASAEPCRAKARVEYQDLLTPWKDADPDIPLLKEAKAEYAKLR
jgi:hypothetical protein